MATITELADSMVRHEKISFRQAHAVSHMIAKASIKKKIPLQEFSYGSYCRYFESEISSAPRMQPQDFNKAADPKNFVDVRNLRRGPSRNAMLKSLKKYKQESEEMLVVIFEYKERIYSTTKIREGAAKKLFTQ